KVLTKSDINDIYLAAMPDSKEKREFEMWRVGLFENESSRDKGMEGFTPYVKSYAECQRNLPLRAEPDSSSENIYKLREGQILKVLGREDKKVQIGSMEGYWYRLLTEDGVTGYTFDYYLTVYNETPEGRDILNARQEEDILLENVVNYNWRPEYFYDMSHENRIDMRSFRDEYRLYINGDSKTIYLKTAEREISIQYEKIANTAYKKYAFLGTTFRIEVYSEYLMSVQYNYEDREYKDAFVRLSTPVEELLTRAQEARDEQLFSFIDNGPLYKSMVYGDLEFQEGGRFSWIKKSALITRKVISSAAGDNGRITFNLFPDESIKDKYQGGMTLIFSNGEKVYLLYTVKEKGIQLLQIPDRYINGQSVVTTDSFYDPISMFFSAPEISASSTAGDTAAE
ncbi:MAG: SH3 domain-containing protein, partial [Spirochaetales bacterium]|nr:SH3 domain-containing protein [Spirochaetales bacterium]